MPDHPYDDLRERIDTALRDFEELSASERLELAEPAALEVWARVLYTTLTAVSASLGECRLEDPPSPLRPVIDADGNFKWCCNHYPEHCRP
jgi:hypothetical protein